MVRPRALAVPDVDFLPAVCGLRLFFQRNLTMPEIAKADPNDPQYKRYLTRVRLIIMGMQMAAMVTPMIEDDELVSIISDDINASAEKYYDQWQKIREAKKKK